MELPAGSRCATHPDDGAVFLCARCGDFGCAACRADDRCRACALRGKETPSAYRPVPYAYARFTHGTMYLVLGVAVGALAFNATTRDPAAGGIAIAIGMAAFLASIPLWARWARSAVGVRTMLGCRREIKAAANLMLEGHWAAAAGRLDALCHEAVRIPPLHVQALVLLGASLAALGDVVTARDRLLAVLRSGWIEAFQFRVTGLPTVLHGTLATTYWMLQDDKAAREHRDVARARCPPAKRCLVAYLDAFSDAREGSYQAVLEQHTVRCASLEPAMRPLNLGGLAILHGFALEQLGRSDEATTALEEVPEKERNGVHGSLGVGWPEMAAFLEARGLGPARTDRSA